MSLPVIESIYHEAIERVDDLIIDFSECYYIDPEGVRWLAAAKAARKVGFVDRRRSRDRRTLDPAATQDRRGGEDPRAGPRRRKRDRRWHSEF